ncbi:MAG: hypothetical protein IH886_02560 [Nitrospinae bacterium]|nr:hypothetical protein [Nitrospinota bacterium]
MVRKGEGYLKNALSFMYQNSAIGKNENIDQLPQAISNRKIAIDKASCAYGSEISRERSIVEMRLILGKANESPVIAAMSSHMVGIILNEADRLMYSLDPESDGLYFCPQRSQSQFEWVMKHGSDPYQNILRGAIELGTREGKYPAKGFRRTGPHPLFNQRRKKNTAQLILLPNIKREGGAQ